MSKANSLTFEEITTKEGKYVAIKEGQKVLFYGKVEGDYIVPVPTKTYAWHKLKKLVERLKERLSSRANKEVLNLIFDPEVSVWFAPSRPPKLIFYKKKKHYSISTTNEETIRLMKRIVEIRKKLLTVKW